MIKLKDLLKEEKEQLNEDGKQPVNEAKGYHPQLKIPSDVSYYERDWVAVFKEWGNKDYGPRESDIYDWDDQSHYENVNQIIF